MEDIKGKKYGRLLAIKPTHDRQNGHIVWLCKCDCGNTHRVIASVLKRGGSLSCGCYRRDLHYIHGGKGTRLYEIWKNIRQRCYNSNNPKYHRYGGRGILICKEWQSFNKFKWWSLLNGYEDHLVIDRIDNDGDYCPENCQWLTVSQSSKKRHLDNPHQIKRRDMMGGIMKGGDSYDISVK